jgi:hypothetical protein
LSAPPDDERIAAILRDLALRRGRGKTFCPSEAARALADDWRPLMPQLRRVAGEMQRRGELQATRKGAPIEPETAAGPIRLGLPGE